MLYCGEHIGTGEEPAVSSFILLIALLCPATVMRWILTPPRMTPTVSMKLSDSCTRVLICNKFQGCNDDAFGYLIHRALLATAKQSAKKLDHWPQIWHLCKDFSGKFFE